MPEDVEIRIEVEEEMSAGQLVDTWMTLKKNWEETRQLTSKIESSMDEIAEQLSTKYSMNMPMFTAVENPTVSAPSYRDSTDEDAVVSNDRGGGRVEAFSPTVGAEEVSYIPPAQGPVAVTRPSIDPKVAAARSDAGVVAQDTDSGQGFLQSIMGQLNSIQGSLK